MRKLLLLFFLLATFRAQAQEDCTTAQAAVEGTNTIPSTATANPYWYTFTMPSDGRLQITNSTPDWITVYNGACNDLHHQGANSGDFVSEPLQNGEQVFIKADTYNGTYDWGLAVVPLRDGDKCDLPVTAVEGANTIPNDAPFIYWYSFTMPSEGTLQITNPSNDYITVYNESCQELNYQAGNNSDFTTPLLQSGEEVFIKAYSWEGKYTWELNVVPPQAGETCELAVAAVEGSNTIPEAATPDYWYSFTMPSEGTLQITNPSNDYITVYSGSCQELNHQGENNGDFTTPLLQSGEQVLIKAGSWEGKYTWELTVASLQAGDKCDLPVTAVEGANTIPNEAPFIYWYSFTMPSEGKLQINHPSSDWITVYNGSCQELNHQAGNNGDFTTPLLQSGEEVFIKAESWAGKYAWELIVVPPQAGETCELPVSAIEGTNNIPADAPYNYWYAFTMPSDGKIKLTNPSASYFEITTGTCDGGRMWKGAKVGNFTSDPLKQGDQLLIRSITHDKSVDWNLEVVPLEAGDNCELAATAVEGTNTIPTSPTPTSSYWYSFTMPSDGKLQITNASTKNISIFSGSCAERIYNSNGDTDFTSNPLKAGDQVYIACGASYIAFSWDLQVVPLEAGDNCELAATAVEGTNTIPTSATLTSTYWYSFTMPSYGKLQITNASTQSIFIWDGSCAKKGFNTMGREDFESTPIQKDETIFIQCNTQEGPYSWGLSVVSVQPGDDCTNALAANVGTNTVTATAERFRWFKFVMPTSEKLQISSLSDLNVSIWKGTSCGDKEGMYSNKGKADVSTINTGDSVFIAWHTNQVSANFDWELSFAPYEAGDRCDMAVVAKEGANLVPATNGYYWLSYTLPSNGKLEVTSPFNDNIRLLAGDCINEEVLARARNGSLSADSLQAGKKVLIKVYNSNHFVDGNAYDLNLKFTPKDQVITFAEIPAKVIGDADFTLEASASSGLPVTYSSANPEVATISGNTVSIFGAGTTTITASQAGDTIYNAASKEQVLTVSKKEQTISFEAITDQLVDAQPISLIASASSGLPLTVSLTGPATIADQVITLDGTPGTVEVSLSQAGDAQYLAVTESFTFNVNELSCKLVATLGEVVNVACAGTAKGSVDITVEGGLQPLTYSLDGETFQESASFTDLSAGDYTFTVKDGNGCTTTVEASLSSPDPIAVEGTIEVIGGFPEYALISLNVSGGTAPYTYAWSHGPTTADVDELVSGTYEVVVTDAAGCTQSKSFEISNVTSLEEEIRQGIGFYPVPASDQLNVEINFSEVQDTRITILNLLGTELLEHKPGKLNSKTVSIPLEGLKEGVYFLRTEAGDASVTRKFIIRK